MVFDSMTNEYSSIKRVEVRVQDLKIGMYVAQLDKPWENSSFLFQGFPIESDEQIEQLKRECRSVFIEQKTGELAESQINADNNLSERKDSSRVRRFSKQDEANPRTLSNALPSALAAFKRTQKELQAIHKLALQNKKIDVHELELTVNDMLVSMQAKPEALLLLRNLKDVENYTTEHQLRVSILSIGFGLFLGMSQEQIRTLGLAALLYDIGKARMPSIVLNKPAKINRQEALLLKNHPEESFRILSKVDNLSEVVKEVALSHHERADGKGYPRHIHKDRVSRSAKIVSIIDAYDAITSDRAYSKAKTLLKRLKC